MKFYPGGSTGWVDVRDVADAVLKCMTENFNGERFIVSSENISYKMYLKNRKRFGCQTSFNPFVT